MIRIFRIDESYEILGEFAKAENFCELMSMQNLDFCNKYFYIGNYLALRFLIREGTFLSQPKNYNWLGRKTKRFTEEKQDQ